MSHEPAAHRERWLVGVTEYAGLTSYTGGIGRHYASLLPALVRAGVDVDLVLFADDAVPGADLQGVRLAGRHRRARGPGWVQPLVRALQFRRDARRIRADRVFIPEWAGLGALLPASLRPITNLATSMRLSTEVSGVPVSSLPRDRRAVAAVQSWCEDRQIRRSRGLIPISNAMLARNERLLGALPNSVVVRNCIDVDAVRSTSSLTPLPEGWPDGDDPILLFLGRLERKKGVTVAARAFAEVSAEHPDACLVFAGSSGDSRFEPTRQQLLDLVPAEARSRVVFLGHVEGPSLYRGIEAATLILCPSLWEGFGQVALEAKALGTPVIVTTGSGFDDFCRDGVDCAMVPPGDASALAAAIDLLLGHPALAAALAARASAEIHRFTADAVAPDLLAAVRRLTRSAPSASNR